MSKSQEYKVLAFDCSEDGAYILTTTVVPFDDPDCPIKPFTETRDPEELWKWLLHDSEDDGWDRYRNEKVTYVRDFDISLREKCEREGILFALGYNVSWDYLLEQDKEKGVLAKYF